MLQKCYSQVVWSPPWESLRKRLGMVVHGSSNTAEYLGAAYRRDPPSEPSSREGRAEAR